MALEFFKYGASFENGYHVTPLSPGYSSDIKESTFEEYEYPNGQFWTSAKGRSMAADPWRGVVGRQTT
jgi:hypothetical protein